MKKIVFLAVLPLMFMGCEKMKILTVSEVPVEISQFINNHFPENGILQGIKETDGLELTYFFTLENQFTLEFNRKKEIIDINGFTRLPDSVIPAKLLMYVTTHFPEQYIIGWELSDRNQQIKLNNGFEFEFNMKGEFLRIDN